MLQAVTRSGCVQPALVRAAEIRCIAKAQLTIPGNIDCYVTQISVGLHPLTALKRFKRRAVCARLTTQFFAKVAARAKVATSHSKMFAELSDPLGMLEVRTLTGDASSSKRSQHTSSGSCHD